MASASLDFRSTLRSREERVPRSARAASCQRSPPLDPRRRPRQRAMSPCLRARDNGLVTIPTRPIRPHARRTRVSLCPFSLLRRAAGARRGGSAPARTPYRRRSDARRCRPARAAGSTAGPGLKPAARGRLGLIDVCRRRSAPARDDRRRTCRGRASTAGPGRPKSARVRKHGDEAMRARVCQRGTPAAAAGQWPGNRKQTRSRHRAAMRQQI